MSAEPGGVHYILVQHYDYSEFGLEFDVPITLTVENPQQEQPPGGDSSSPALPSPPAVGAVACQGALPLDVGVTTSVDLFIFDKKPDQCYTNGEPSKSNGLVEVLGAWFTVLGAGTKLQVSACPAK
eukprot:15339670-Ditylum_brightwellii.AAC.1